MSDDRDLPLEEWRAAWRGLDAPAPADELSGADPETRAVVGWMRDAWASLEVPAPRIRKPRRLRRRLLVLPLAAAAALLLVLGWARFTRVPKTDVAPVSPLQGASVEEPTIASLDPDQIVMRSGPVRLVLVTSSPETPGQ